MSSVPLMSQIKEVKIVSLCYSTKHAAEHLGDEVMNGLVMGGHLFRL